MKLNFDAAEFCPEDAKTVIFSINPNSGSSDRRNLCDAIAQYLDQQGFETILLTDLDEVKRTVAASLERKSLRAVVSAGGDGTVSLLANLLPPETPFAILPLGTENLLGRHLGLKADQESFVSMIQQGKSIRLDAGRANGKLFLVVASCGFDAEVVRRLDEARTGHINYFSWLNPIFKTVFSYRFPKLNLTIDGKKIHPAVHWAFVFNIPRYAMNLRFTPEADSQDGMLNSCTFRKGGVIRGVWYSLTVFTRRHKRIRDTEFSKFQRMTIQSDQPVPYELDGDPGGMLPLEIETLPSALKVLVP